MLPVPLFALYPTSFARLLKASHTSSSVLATLNLRSLNWTRIIGKWSEPSEERVGTALRIIRFV